MPKPSEAIETILNTYEHYKINTGNNTIDLPYNHEQKIQALIQYLDEQYEEKQSN